jgi:hypothetical protein
MSTQLVKREFFVVEMPDQAPALGFDPSLESFSWQEIYPDNYWNEENCKARREALGGWPVLKPARVVIRPVIDPEDKEPDLSPRIVMEFEGSGPALVFNKSRCQMAAAIARTPNPAKWAERLGHIVLFWGDFNKRLQLCIDAAPDEDLPDWAQEAPPAAVKANGKAKATVADINDELGLA